MEEESSPEHVCTHDELVAVEEDAGDVAEDEDEDDADEDEGEVDFLLGGVLGADVGEADAAEDAHVEADEGDDGDDAGDHQPRPVDVEPEGGHDGAVGHGAGEGLEGAD